MHTIEQTGDWLKNNHIYVNDDWLKACMEWIQEENQGQGLTNDDINSQVYEQWLLADLHELETCCLPGEVTTAQKFELSGTFALQIDSIVDVSVSFYSQQQKQKGTENANVHVNAEEPTQRPWEAKPSRMLMFKLTDGTYNVQGMEYRPISCLNQQTAPGAKILVHGNVLCRHGVLMLTNNNIKFLGGEVDTLVEANTVLNTLQSAMAASEEYAGKEHKQTFPGTPIRHCKQSVQNNQINHGNQPRAWGNSRGSANQSSQKGIIDTKPFITKYMKSEAVTQNFARKNQHPNQNMFDDDAMLDDDMDSLMQEMIDDDFELNVQNGNASNQILANNRSANQNPYSCSRQVTPVQNNSVKVPSSRSDVGFANRNQKTSSNIAGHPISTVSSASGVLNSDDLVAMEFEDDMDFPPDDFMTSTSKVSVPQNHRNFNKQSGAGISSEKSNTKTQNQLSKQNFGEKIIFGGEKYQNRNYNNQMKLDRQTNFREPGMSKSSLMNGSRPVVLNNVDMTVNISNKGLDVSIESQDSVPKLGRENNATGNTKLGLSEVKSESKNGKVDGTERSAMGGKPHQSSIQRFLTPNKEVAEQPVKETFGTDVQTEYPFTYLSKVMALPVQEQPSYHTVKAYISTLTSRLSSAGGRWTLSCKINDGTMAVDVDLSNNVLTEMIGFSWKEAQEMKSRLKTDPGVKEVLTEGIQQCQQKLIELMCLLELEICARNPRPLIVATKQLTCHHIDMLYNRVIANLNIKL